MKRALAILIGVTLVAVMLPTARKKLHRLTAGSQRDRDRRQVGDPDRARAAVPAARAGHNASLLPCSAPSRSPRC